MAAETNADRAEWQPSPPPPEDSVISPEHLALVDFAQRLGSVTFNDEPGIADAGDVRQHANLLMSLLSSPPHVVSDDIEHNSLSSASAASSAVSSANDHHYLSDASTSSATTTSSAHRRDSFRFSHPSLSLDCKWKTSFPYQRPLRTPCTAPDKEEDAENEVETPPPAVLLGRSLKVDDREAHRLSADAMARNLMLSFQKAIKWRIQSWMDTLSASLVRKEQAMLRRNATEEELRELLKTSEAQLIMKLRHVTENIEVLHAETCFHVLPQRTQKEHQAEESEDPPLAKRRRIESEDSELHMGETEYKYAVGHALEFDGTIHLKTPAGHSEITLEVPGMIEGTFLSSEPGMEDLTAVEVEIDTNILASMVEKSCRIIVRSSVEHVCKTMAAASADNEEEEKEEVETEEPLKKPVETCNNPRPTLEDTIYVEGGNDASMAAIVTPRYKEAPCVEGVGGSESAYLQIPDDFDTASNRRRVTPLPRSPDTVGVGHFTPSTPSHKDAEICPMPSMVSPAPANESFHDGGFRLKQRGGDTTNGTSNGPNLPVLVEVACAAMQAKSGLTGQ